jgi:hypothetical protein
MHGSACSGDWGLFGDLRVFEGRLGSEGRTGKAPETLTEVYTVIVPMLFFIASNYFNLSNDAMHRSAICMTLCVNAQSQKPPNANAL